MHQSISMYAIRLNKVCTRSTVSVEYISLGDFIYVIDAIDADIGTNGELRYQISGKDAINFKIDQHGVISTSHRFDSTQSHYAIMLTVFDRDGLNTTATLGIYKRPAALFPVYKVRFIHTHLIFCVKRRPDRKLKHSKYPKAINNRSYIRYLRDQRNHHHHCQQFAIESKRAIVTAHLR